ncbi:MAG: hypothetical protein HOP20_03810 [Sulfuriferula sp.]|nr:hypothetical protein [Sulfuriferula sp.]
MRLLSIVLFTFCCYGLSYAESGDSSLNKVQRVHDVKKNIKKQKIKHKAHSQAVKPTTATKPVVVNEQAHVVAPACKAGYEPRLAQADDMLCVTHQDAMRIANENKTAIVAGKPNPMTTNLDLSCKTPDYTPRQATPTDNVCVPRSSRALVRMQNHPDN